jgi:hypothetical protein
MKSNERARVAYDRGHSSRAVFSASHSSTVMSMKGMPS